MDGLELCLLHSNIIEIADSAETIARLGVVSLESSHGLLMLLHVEVGIFAEIVVLTLFVTHGFV